MKKIFILFVLVAALFTACGSDHLYDGAITYDSRNGSNEVIGKYAYIKCNKDYVTEEALNDVYFNYFAKEDSDLDYLIIQYSDDANYGVYMGSGMVLENARLTVNDSNDYILGDDSEATQYLPVNGQLKKQ